MCGRYTLTRPADTLAALFQMKGDFGIPPRHNIAPGQFIPALRGREGGGEELALFRWGLIPSWAKAPGTGARTINARAETLAEKPSFRAAYRRRRCLIPADGFYEWAKEGSKKTPHHIHLRNHAPFAFAGLWEIWQGPSGEEMETCTIITTGANELLAPLHPRMPVIMPAENFGRWLDPREENTRNVQSLLRPYPAEEMAHRPVGTKVNNTRNDGPECLEGPAAAVQTELNL